MLALRKLYLDRAVIYSMQTANVRKKRTCFLPIAVLGIYACLNSLSHGEVSNLSKYGNCDVVDDVDLFSDKVSYVLRCSKDDAYIMIMRKEKSWTIAFVASNYQRRPDWTPSHVGIVVIVRFDSMEPRKYNMGWDNGLAFSVTNRRWEDKWDDEQIALFLTELASSRQVAIRVGDKSAVLDLNGSSKAVDEFLRRLTHAGELN